ncbi:hypothetical protein BZA05DRAFT_353332 [Tricharina praecox]|uniref:uncharacterized protein n=1 Tax=Tricharina praecox TaxID=43433 RepID=UPI00221ECCA6|nr:uncharacterized protein BZA05DRAFT_353332 [Tricharina praecox]KAI5851770.1 hypothetical protein BZA05DRAFT_353332 [Tricharina praecox]
MVHIAIAGASSGLGDSISRAVLSNPDNKLTVLTRGRQPQLTSLGANVMVVDYTSMPSLTAALSGVHTLISCVWAPGSNLAVTQSLLAACKAAGVKRYAPSEFATAGLANKSIALYAQKDDVWKLVRESGLEYTAFRLGVFMNYLSAGAPGAEQQALKLFPVVVDVKARTATIPGTGEDRVSFTAIEDVGRFVEAACQLEKWGVESTMFGETWSYKEVVKLAEEVTGETFDVKYLSREEISGRIEEKKDDVMGKFYEEVLVAIVDGLGEVKGELNELTDVKPIGVKAFLEKWWGKK